MTINETPRFLHDDDETAAAVVMYERLNSADVTSSDHNAAILDKIRSNDPTFTDLFISSAHDGQVGSVCTTDFIVHDGDVLECLGYFIGRNTTLLHVCIATDLSEVGDRDALLRGINGSRCVKVFELYDHLGLDVGLLTDFIRMNRKLKSLTLGGNDIKDDDSGGGVADLAIALVNQPSLESLTLQNSDLNIIGCMSLCSQACSSNVPIAPNLKHLDLSLNSIDDAALEVLATSLSLGTGLKSLDLSQNPSIGAAGLRSLATLLQSENCRLEDLHLNDMHIGDDGAEALATALSGNTTLRRLHISLGDAGISASGWSTFWKLLSDASSINNTYLSSHTLQVIGSNNDSVGAPTNIIGLNSDSLHK